MLKYAKSLERKLTGSQHSSEKSQTENEVVSTPISVGEKRALLPAGVHAWPYSPLPQPELLKFQNPASYLHSGKEVENWTPNEYAPCITELANSERYHFLQIAAGYLVSSGTKGDYHEYGTFAGNSFRAFLTHAKLMGYVDWDPDVKFYGFDSFEGLPEFKRKSALDHVWKPGSMAFSEKDFWQSLKDHGMYLDKIEVIKGFFNDTLTKGLQKKYMDSGRKIAFANIDCDLYESAAPVFEFIEPLLQEGTLVYIDDYFAGYNGSPKRGVAGAFNEYREKSKFSFHSFRTVGYWGRSFIAYNG